MWLEEEAEEAKEKEKGREEVPWLEHLCVLRRGGRCFGRLSEHEHELEHDEGKGEGVCG